MSKPVIVIRNAEDSPEWIDRHLVNAYLQADYVVLLFENPVRIGVLQNAWKVWLDKQQMRSFTIITAWNPRSRILTGRRNRWRNNRLEADLRRVAKVVWGAYGVGQDGQWPQEESFFVPDIAREDAVELGRKYRQNAIVRWERGGVPELLWL